jgi:hypothetical protein
MMGVEKFSQEFFDNFHVNTMIQDLNNLRKDVVRLEALEELKPYQEQDLDADRFFIQSLQNVLTYYIPYHDYEERVGVPHPRPLD